MKKEKLTIRAKNEIMARIAELHQRTYDQEAADLSYEKMKKSRVTATFPYSQFHLLSKKECAAVVLMRILPNLNLWGKIKIKSYVRKVFR